MLVFFWCRCKVPKAGSTSFGSLFNSLRSESGGGPSTQRISDPSNKYKYFFASWRKLNHNLADSYERTIGIHERLLEDQEEEGDFTAAALEDISQK